MLWHIFLVTGVLCDVAEWKVHRCGDNIVAFQKGQWLRIKDNITNCGVNCSRLVVVIT